MNRDELAAALTAAIIEPGFQPEDVVGLYNDILALLPAQQQQIQPSAPPPPSNSDVDPDWEDVIANPSSWWDNRGNKKSPKGPDFSHKTRKDPNSGYKVGLWLHDAPEGVKDRLPRTYTAEAAPTQRAPQYLPDEEPF